ncbi:MAG: winged helix-turn-helix domain-containing protein [Candidatus Bathyarchaeota archaeon]
MAKRSQNPNAYILGIKNTKKGVHSRESILMALDEEVLSTKDVMGKTNLSYSALLYHLRLLEKHTLVRRRPRSKRQIIWEQTGLGQQPILN